MTFAPARRFARVTLVYRLHGYVPMPLGRPLSYAQTGKIAA